MWCIFEVLEDQDAQAVTGEYLKEVKAVLKQGEDDILEDRDTVKLQDAVCRWGKAF